jgi:hypothetical protein
LVGAARKIEERFLRCASRPLFAKEEIASACFGRNDTFGRAAEIVAKIIERKFNGKPQVQTAKPGAPKFYFSSNIRWSRMERLLLLCAALKPTMF